MSCLQVGPTVAERRNCLPAPSLYSPPSLLWWPRWLGRAAVLAASPECRAQIRTEHATQVRAAPCQLSQGKLQLPGVPVLLPQDNGRSLFLQLSPPPSLLMRHLALYPAPKRNSPFLPNGKIPRRLLIYEVRRRLRNYSRSTSLHFTPFVH